jgi:ABC-2 type transporter/Polysaccharide lyase family 8, N terminal alpha-helical domain
MFNESVSKTYGNWWDWEIGAPQSYNNTLVLINVLTSDTKGKYLRAVDRFVPNPNYRLNGIKETGVDLNISFLDQFIVMECFLLTALGLASTVAGLIRNMNNVGAANMLIIIPSCMLGGCFWPVSIMPDFMQKVANFIPQYWAIDAFTRLSEGQRLGDVGQNLAILGLFAVILISFGSVILKPGVQGRLDPVSLNPGVSSSEKEGSIRLF